MVKFHPLAREEHDYAISFYASVDEELGRDFDNRIALSGNSVNTTGTNIGGSGETGEPTQRGAIHSSLTGVKSRFRLIIPCRA